MLYTRDLVAGDRVRLVALGETDLNYCLRLSAFGIEVGVEVLVVRVAPLGCPVQLNIHGISIVLRKAEAGYLEWEHV